jgi:hypothetical protein
MLNVALLLYGSMCKSDLGPAQPQPGGAVLFQPLLPVAMIEPATHDHDCNDQNNRDGDCPNKKRVHEGPNEQSVSGDSMRFPDGGGDGSTVKRPLLERKSADAKS